MAQRAAFRTESLMQRLYLREIKGSLQPHKHARPKKLFTKIPGRLGFGLKTLVPQAVLDEGHVFLGFTKNGQFVISYTLHIEADDHIAYPLYSYRLQWWLFVPQRPLKKIAEVRLFEESEIENDLYIVFCEWPRDNKKIVVYGQSVSVCGEENYQCNITVTAVPPISPCSDCENTQATLPTETGVSAWCLDHALTFHTKYDLAPPYPSFSPHVHMKLDGVIILNTGHSIITLDISCGGDGQEEDWSDYTNCSTPLMEPESPVEPVVLETEVLDIECGASTSTGTVANCGKLNRDAILSFSQEFLHGDRDPSACDNYLPSSQLPAPDSGADTQTTDSQKSRLTLYDFAGSDDGSVVDEDFKGGFAQPRYVPNLSGKVNEDAVDSKCNCGDSRLRSKYLRQQLQQSMRYSHGLRFTSPQALSPSRCQAVRRSHSQDNIPHDQAHCSPGEGPSLKTDHSLQDSSLIFPPCDKENVCIPPASPNHCDLTVDLKNTPYTYSYSLKPDSHLGKSLEGGFELRASQRSFFSPSICSSTGSCASKASTSPIVYLDSSQSVTMNVRNFTYPDPSEAVNPPTDTEDDLEMAYHSLLPLTVTGSGHMAMSVSNHNYKTPLQHEVIVKQLTLDVEHYIWETIRHKADWGNRYIDVADYDVQILDVCPTKSCLIAKVTLWVHARQEVRLSLDIKKRKGLGLYQTCFTFEWQQDSGIYTTLDIEDLQETEEKNMKKLTRAQQRKELISLRKQAYVPQSYTTSVHVLTNEAAVKGKSLSMLLDPHHYVAILL